MFPHENLSSLFTPRRIAVLGVSAKGTDSPPGYADTGCQVLDNILHFGFPGPVFATGDAAHAYPGCVPARSIGEIPGPLDLALVCLPAADIPHALEELAKLPTKAAVIYSSGLRGLSGPTPGETEHIVKKLAQQHGIAILGAKSNGFFRSGSRLNALNAPILPKAGSIGFFSQSGSLASAILDWAAAKGTGFSSFVTLGNKSGLDEADILAQMADNPAISVIVGCLETIESGPRFMHGAHRATRKKPVILLRTGDTDAGSRALAAHSGATIGEHQAYAAAIHQTGIIPARRLEELFSLARAFTGRPLPQGPNTAILVNGGGLGILAADACAKAGLSIARLSTHSMDTLRSFLPPYASLLDPIDVLPDADAARIMKSADVLLDDPNTHSLLLVVSPGRPGVQEETARAIAEKAASCDKPIFVCLMGGGAAEAGRAHLEAHGIPGFEFPYPAADAIAAAYRFAGWRERPLPVEISYRYDLSRARKIVNETRAAGLAELSGSQAQALLAAFEMPLPEAQLARTSDEAVAAAKAIGYPVRLLLDLPGLPPERKDFRSVGPVEDETLLREEFLALTGKAHRLYPELAIRGCLVQACPEGFAQAVDIGFRRDPVFGPLFFLRYGSRKEDQETASLCRIAPLSLDDAHDLARQARAPGSAVTMPGASGTDDTSCTELEDILLIMSELAMNMPEVTEAFCGPVFFSANWALVSDAHFFLKEKTPQ